MENLTYINIKKHEKIKLHGYNALTPRLHKCVINQKENVYISYRDIMQAFISFMQTQKCQEIQV